MGQDWIPLGARGIFISLGVLLAFFAGASHAAQPNLILQVGHMEETVGRPSISPDGKLAASMDRGRIVILWDTETGRQLKRLIPSEEKEGNLFLGNASGKGSTTISAGQTAFSPDGKMLAATAAQGVPLWQEAMRASAQRGRNIAVVKGEEQLADYLQRTLQQPRVFYRREAERSPFVVGGK